MATDSDMQKPANYKRLIMEGSDFIVVIDNDQDIDWRCFDNYHWESVKPEDVRRFNLVINKAAELENNWNELPDALSNKRLIAEAIARALDRDVAAAVSMLDTVEKALREQLQDRRRNRYLLAASIAALPFFLILLYQLDSWFSKDVAPGFWVLMSASFGAMGALLSIIMGYSEPKCTPTAPVIRPVVEGAARIVGGAIAGSLLAVAVKSNWVLAPMNNAIGGNETAIIAAFAAGFLERLAPSIVSKFESKTGEGKALDATTPDKQGGLSRSGGSAV